MDPCIVDDSVEILEMPKGNCTKRTQPSGLTRLLGIKN